MGSYEIQWKRSAGRDLRRIDPQHIRRIIQAVNSLGSDPFPRDSRKLRGTEHQYRIRIGDYRVIYEVDLKSNILTVFHVPTAERFTAKRGSTFSIPTSALRAADRLTD